MEPEKIEKLYQKIAEHINSMIPVEWDKLFLHIIYGDDFMSRVYFYFFPTGQIEPIYSLDIPKKFTIEEDFFDEIDDTLVDICDELYEAFEELGNSMWTNLTMILDDRGKFKIDFDYEKMPFDDLTKEREVWMKKYLDGAHIK